jgi:hypothetical protein
MKWFEINTSCLLTSAMLEVASAVHINRMPNILLKESGTVLGSMDWAATILTKEATTTATSECMSYCDNRRFLEQNSRR